jgi:hypothetical protein
MEHSSALNSRSPELWRKTRRRERFCYPSTVSRCAGRFVRAPIYLGSPRLEGTRRKLGGTALAEGEELGSNILHPNGQLLADVSFAPKSGQIADISRCPLCANRVLTRRNKTYRVAAAPGPDKAGTSRPMEIGRRAGVSVMLRLERVGSAAIQPTVPVVRPAHDHCARCRRRTNRGAPPRASTNER